MALRGGLPAAWAGQRQWRILAIGFGRGQDFIAAWQAWKHDPQRPGILHFVAIEESPASAADLASDELARQWYGLVPGFHRLSFEGGRVLLTLCVGGVQEMLKQQAFHADSVFLDGPMPKAVARLCRRGAHIAGPDGAEGVYDPAWEPKGLPSAPEVTAGRCVVVGAGLAGAAAASSLARRGWQVIVLDAAGGPAAGASGLPAGLLAPHQSPDDNPLSRLSRAGVRCTLQAAESLLQQGEAWEATGVLENRLEDERAPPALGEALEPWTRIASPAQKALAGLPASALAWWHEKAAWIRPALLVQALLRAPGIETIFASPVRKLVRDGDQWRVVGDADRELARCDLAVVAAAYDSALLLPRRLPLGPVRGQVSWSHDREGIEALCPVNGNGHFLPDVPLPGGRAWLSGSTYGRGDANRDERAQDHAANLGRLQSLLPAAAAALAPRVDAGAVHAWTGVRCASSDRRPLVGRIDEGLWVTTAMGSRGLTFSLLCAELLAARLHGEPLPLERKLADALDAARQLS